jgi:thiol:disulfide interchange protein
MKTKVHRDLVLWGCTALLFASTPAGAADVPNASLKKDIYDEKADAKKQIAAAVSIARKENKFVLLQFGANWCGWCHRLHNLFESDRKISEKLKSDFVVVLVDVNEGHNADTNIYWDNPTRFGLPVIVIFDPKGGFIVTKNTAELEEGDYHSPEKVLAFLNASAPKK